MIESEQQVDLYGLLGVSEEADEREIKLAFRRLALQHHPDKVLDSLQNGDKFTIVQQAYETLINPVTRKAYDRDRVRRLGEGLHAERVVLGLWLKDGETLVDRHSDFHYESDGQEYRWTHRCRCGECYEVFEEEAIAGDMLVMQCLGCSLYICIEMLA